jgi:CHAD domain-containing protein
MSVKPSLKTKHRFRIAKDESPDEGLARVIQELLAHIQDCLNSFPGNSEAIHQTRVACKRLRAIAKLLKKNLPKPARQLNAEIRDIAHLLSLQRDSEVKLEVIRLLLKDADDSQRHLLQQLAEYYQAGAIDQAIIEKNVELAKEKAMALYEVINTWKFRKIEETKIIKALDNEYELFRQGYKDNRNNPDPVDMHTWRKHAKTCLYQSQILQTHLKTRYTQHIDQLKKLGTLLGHYHDLVLILDDIEEPVIGDWGENEQSLLRDYIKSRQAALGKKILKHGKEF